MVKSTFRKYKKRSMVRNRKRYARRVLKSPTGFLSCTRRLPEIFVVNSAIANTPTIIDPTANCLQLGSPVANQWGTYDIPFSLQFMLSQVINASEVTAISDKYRIKSAYIRVFFNSSNTSTGSLYSMPQVYHITDHDDSSPATPSQVREKMGTKYKTFRNASSYVGIKVNPRPVAEVYKSALTTGYSPMNRAPWLDCNTSDIPHYGVKGTLSNVNLPVNTAAQVGFKFDITLAFELKDIQ